ncbi:hypothetical protein [Spirillospora sp. NPDC047279]|uniref:phage tail termination protein n=1 Tax=Spirillospora sp. NPDC047279 TaxID=3155478 RepID=UPI0033D65FD0
MTLVPKLPDMEALALDLLNHYMPGEASYVVTPQADWSKAMPFVWVVRVGGTTVNAVVDHAILSVTVIAAQRKQASDLARKVQAAFYQASMDAYFSDEGVVSFFETIKGPQPDRDGLSGKHPDSHNFDATYDLWARART